MINLRSINEYDFNNKNVIIRVDFNVPVEDGKIADDTRIVNSIRTIKYIYDKNPKRILLLSHFGKVKSEEDKKNNSLSIVVNRLEELLGVDVDFIKHTSGEVMLKELSDSSNTIKLVENTRFEDIIDKKESNCDLELSKFWASLGDIFVFDGFGVSHRNHASVVGIAKYIESCAGFLVMEEIEKINSFINDESYPFTIIMGGAKISDKTLVINKLIDKCNNIIIGGAMAFTFLKAKGYNVGKSLVDDDNISFCKELLDKYKDKIILPVDIITNNNDVCNIDSIGEDDIGLDIGPRTISLFKKELGKSRRLFLNGTMGKNEDKNYQNGTKEIFHFLDNSNIKILVGGGDTVSAVKEFNVGSKFYHISTGGGATLEYLGGNIGEIFTILSNSSKDNE